MDPVGHRRGGPDAGSHGEHRLDSEAVPAREAPYASMPVPERRKPCPHSCSRHVDASGVERARVAAAGVDLDALPSRLRPR